MTYHALTLGDSDVSAAFVAAASRAMNSPRTTHAAGSRDLGRARAVREAVALPADAQLVVDSATPALGLDEAQRLFAAT